MDTYRKQWVTKKAQTALRLESGECGGSYSEAILILCSTLSTLAAEIWPGKGIDRKRFVELLTEYAPPHLHTTRISVPFLTKHLRASAKTNDLTQVGGPFHAASLQDGG